MVYLLALGAAFSNALTTVFQRQGVEGAPPGASLHLRLITYAVRRPVWLAGFATMIAGFAFQVGALRFGPLSTVQPILTSELIFLVVVLCVGLRRRLGWHEWIGAFATAGGLGTFLSLADPGGGDLAPAGRSWVEALAVASTTIVLAVLAARRGPPVWRALLFGSAGAIAFAVTAALVKVTTTYASQGTAAIFVHWEPYAIVASGLGGLFLAQNAFHAGPITASQSALVIVDAMSSIGLGVSLFGDKIHTGGAAGPLEILALIVVCTGVLILCRSPIVAQVHAEDHHGHATSKLISEAPAS